MGRKARLDKQEDGLHTSQVSDKAVFSHGLRLFYLFWGRTLGNGGLWKADGFRNSLGLALDVKKVKISNKEPYISQRDKQGHRVPGRQRSFL